MRFATVFKTRQWPGGGWGRAVVGSGFSVPKSHCWLLPKTALLTPFLYPFTAQAQHQMVSLLCRVQEKRTKHTTHHHNTKTETAQLRFVGCVRNLEQNPLTNRQERVVVLPTLHGGQTDKQTTGQQSSAEQCECLWQMREDSLLLFICVLITRIIASEDNPLFWIGPLTLPLHHRKQHTERVVRPTDRQSRAGIKRMDCAAEDVKICKQYVEWAC